MTADPPASRTRPLSSRTLHRWLGLGAAVLFAAVASTGVLLQIEQMFGQNETQKEELARLTSPATLDSRLTVDETTLTRARISLLRRLGRRPVDSIDWQIKGRAQTFVFHLGGREPLRAELDVGTGRLLTIESDDEEWLLRLHTGEIFGDGGKALGLFWGVALLAMLVTGTTVYLQLYRARQRNGKGKRGLRRYFWRPGS
jgi:uncharacterized iron-regulated membrane protein